MRRVKIALDGFFKTTDNKINIDYHERAVSDTVLKIVYLNSHIYRDLKAHSEAIVTLWPRVCFWVPVFVYERCNSSPMTSETYVGLAKTHTLLHKEEVIYVHSEPEKFVPTCQDTQATREDLYIT